MNQENANPVDIFDMSDEDFTAQYGTIDSGSLVQPLEEESTDVDSSIEESNTIEDTNQEDEYETDTDTEELSEVSVETDIDTDSEETNGTDTSDDESDTNDLDYEAEFNKLIGSPIKGAGKEITLQSTDDALRLIQMGMGYHKSMEQIKPHKKVISMLEQNNMLDEEKLSYMIDLMNKNPQAISKLVTESEIDVYDLDEEQAKAYKPTNHSVSDERMALDNALNDIKDSPFYSKTVTVIGNEWDDKSRDIIKSNPTVIGIINDHMASGLYETVSNEVERFKMLGKLPYGMSDLEAYKFVGDSLYANEQSQSAPSQGQQQQFEQANVNPPIKKPSRETVIKQKRATNVPRSQGNPRKRLTADDIFNMDDDAFLKKFGSGNFYN